MPLPFSMKRSLLLIALLITATTLSGASSCATPVLPTVRPASANRYELPFTYECNGKHTFAMGISECQYKEGDVMHIRIKAPPSKGEIQVRSCRHHKERDIDTSKPWQDIEWIEYAAEDSCAIVMSVATEDADIQLGKINPYVSNAQYPPLNAKGSFYCWESEKIENFVGQSSCQIPTGIRVDGYLQVDPLKSGQYLVVSKDCGLTQGPTPFLKNSAPIKWSFSSSSAQYCPVSVVAKYDDGTFEEYELYLDFFDAQYRMLPPPLLSQKGADSYACAPQDFAFFDLNDHTKSECLFSGHCIQDGWNSDGLAIGIAWDRAGRSSYTVLPCQGDQCPKPKQTLQYKLKTLSSPQLQ